MLYILNFYFILSAVVIIIFMRLNMKLVSISVLALVMMLMSGTSRAQEIIGIQEQIDALKEEMMILQRKVYRENAEAPINNINPGQAEAKLTQYDEIIRSLNGKIDELEYQIKQLEEKIDTMNKDNDVRFKLLEGKPIPAAQGSLATPKKFDAAVANGAPKSILGDDIATAELSNVADTQKADANALYTAGLEALKAGKSAEAEQNFRLVLDKFPNDKLAGNAQYWLGEVYYSDKNFAKAAVAFAKGYEQYKTGAKGPDCLLKLGLSMMQLNKKDEACLAFVNLPNEFPKASSDIKNKAAQESKKYNCQ